MSDCMILLNQKSFANQNLREAIENIREQGRKVLVRPIWESENAESFLEEALEKNISLIICSGGDGLLHHAINTVKQKNNDLKNGPAFSVMPFGTANDYSKNFQYQGQNVTDQLLMVMNSDIQKNDIGVANDRLFHNSATGGIGALITSETPKTLKDLLGGAAYTLHSPSYLGKNENLFMRFESGKYSWHGDVMFWAVLNGTSAGGQVLCEDADLQDGELDLIIIPKLSFDLLPELLSEFVTNDSSKNQYLQRRKLSSLKITSEKEMVYNLDGESYKNSTLEISVEKEGLKFQATPG